MSWEVETRECQKACGTANLVYVPDTLRDPSPTRGKVRADISDSSQLSYTHHDMCALALTHKCIRTHIYTYTHTYTYMHTYAYIHTYTQRDIHIHTYIQIYKHTYTHMHTYAYVYIHIYRNTQTYTFIHRYIHTCHSKCVEVRGQHVGVGSLLIHGAWDLNLGIQSW